MITALISQVQLGCRRLLNLRFSSANMPICRTICPSSLPLKSCKDFGRSNHNNWYDFYNVGLPVDGFGSKFVGLWDGSQLVDVFVGGASIKLHDHCHNTFSVHQRSGQIGNWKNIFGGSFRSSYRSTLCQSTFWSHLQGHAWYLASWSLSFDTRCDATLRLWKWNPHELSQISTRTTHQLDEKK